MNVLGYTKSGAIRVIFDGDEGESVVPDDMANRHRQMIAEWEAAGNTIPPWVPPPVPLVPLNPRQIRLALLNIGITEAMVDEALLDNPEGQIEWKYAPTYLRDHHLIGALSAHFELPEEQVDDLWKWATAL